MRHLTQKRTYETRIYQIDAMENGAANSDIVQITAQQAVVDRSCRPSASAAHPTLGRGSRSHAEGSSWGAPSVADKQPEQATDARNVPDNAGLGEQSLMVIIERRQLIRGCLALWLSRFCSEFEAVALGDAKDVLSSQLLPRTAVVILVEASLVPSDGWLNEQISLLRNNDSDVQIVMVADASQIRVAEALIGTAGTTRLHSNHKQR